MTELKNIPEGWGETTLGEVADIKYGKDHKHLKDGNIPCLGSGGFMRNVDQILYDKPSVLIPRKGTISNLFFIEQPFWTVDTLFYTKIDDNKIIPKYLYFKLKTINLENMNVGSAVPSLTTAVLNQIEIVIPKNINEQKSIAAILTAFDNKIELLQAQNKTLEELAQTIFTEWFGKETEIWEYVKINDVAEITSSKRIFYEEYVTEGIPFYRSKEIIELSTKPDISTELFISEMRYNEIKEKFDIPKKGDILLTAVGTLGIPFQVRNNREFYFKDGNLIWFKNFNKSITSDFVYNWLKLKSTQDLLNMISIGSTQKALTISSVKELKIPFIKNSELRRIFNKLLKSNLDKVNHNQEQIQTLTKTRDELLPRLMSGEVRVNEFKV
jgi:type I restriction enzyme S subunit